MADARVIEIARAKINLALHVLGRRQDGYHELDSLVAFTLLGDRLSFEPAERTSLAITGPFASELSAGPDNLVLRAAAYFAQRFPTEGVHAHITLEKHLPVASGLGGGSADAAATLRGLARLSGVVLPSREDAILARTLGADVPVCLISQSSRMTGIGEIIRPLAGYDGQPILLVNPASPVATARVFETLALQPGDKAFAGIVDASNLSETRNDLTIAACQLNPAIRDVLSEIAGVDGVRIARMSGSGATCFGLFDRADEAERASREIAARHPNWWCAATSLS
jgi:4-diphosphocytidyl-2-C-methyl-D-erythritol kinase